MKIRSILIAIFGIISIIFLTSFGKTFEIFGSLKDHPDQTFNVICFSFVAICAVTTIVLGLLNLLFINKSQKGLYILNLFIAIAASIVVVAITIHAIVIFKDFFEPKSGEGTDTSALFVLGLPMYIPVFIGELVNLILAIINIVKVKKDDKRVN